MAMESLGFLIQQCSASKFLARGPSLHALVFKTGLQSDTVTCNHIIKMYSNFDRFATARKVFDEMPEQNIVSWSLMISSYTRIKQHSSVAELFSSCQFLSNEHIYSSVITSCSAQRDLRAGQQLHTRTLKLGLSPISFVSNTLISLYAECGLCNNAVKVFDEMPQPGMVAYNSLITGLQRNNQSELAFEIYSLMRRNNLLPDRFTFSGLLKKGKESENRSIGSALHCQAIKTNLVSCCFVGNLLISMYARWDLKEEVLKSFDDIDEQDVISWNTLIASCSHCGDHERALRAFREMLTKITINPDEFTFSSALTSCSGLLSLRFGRELHCHMVKSPKLNDPTCYNSLINMYAKCGSIGKAYALFRATSLPNVHTWNTIIGGLAHHGAAARAFELFEEMKGSHVAPDSVTFLELLASCNHAGLPDKGVSFFNSMQEDYGIAPGVDHVSCLVDLLGRCGRLEEAEECMKRYPFGGNSVVLGSFLSACRLQGNVGVGERMGREMMKMGGLSSSPFVLLSNLYAFGEMWECVSGARKMLKSSGIKKEAGVSFVELKGVWFKFFAGDCFGEISGVLRCFVWDASLVSFKHQIDLI